MSETVPDYLAFNTDILPNASESDAFGPQTAIMALADQLDYIDPHYFSNDYHHYESEKRLVALRREWLVQADEAFRQKEYGVCISRLRLVLEDIDHSGINQDDAKTVIAEIIEHCYEVPTRARGHAAIADIVSIGLDGCVEPSETTPHIQLAS